MNVPIWKLDSLFAFVIHLYSIQKATPGLLVLWQVMRVAADRAVEALEGTKSQYRHSKIPNTNVKLMLILNLPLSLPVTEMQRALERRMSLQESGDVAVNVMSWAIIKPPVDRGSIRFGCQVRVLRCLF